MIQAILLLTVVTLIPALELRASIPCGILPIPIPFLGIKINDFMSWPVAVLICVVVNIILGWFVFLVMGPFFTFVRKWGWFNRRIWPTLEKTQHKIHPYVEKYGELGVAVFIGIPLPGSGVYTGAFGAYLLGLGRRKFAIANVIGVLIAGAAVTALCLLILHGAVGENSFMARLFLKGAAAH